MNPLVASLAFEVDGARVVEGALVPHVAFALRARCLPASREVRSIALRCQLLLEPQRRSYDARAREALSDLFGEPSRWDRTLRPMLWTHATANVGPFQGETAFELAVPCTFDFGIAATRYLDALGGEGAAPIALQFSGSVFCGDDAGALKVVPIAWSCEARYALPADVWRSAVAALHPNSATLTLRRDAFDRLDRFRAARELPTWEAAIDALIDAASGGRA